MNNGLPGAMVMCVVGGEVERGRGSFYQIGLLSNEPTVVTLPAKYLFFLQQNLHFFRVMCDLAFCGNFLKEQCRKCPMCAALQGMMRLESREVQAEGLVKVFFTHNHGSTGFGGCMVVGSGVSRSYQGPGPPFPHPTPFILLLVWIPPLTFIVRRAKCTFQVRPL